MEEISRQQTGFRYGRHQLTVVREIGHVEHRGRKYVVLEVRTHDGLPYISIRLYNSSGHFIKQLLMEPEIAPAIGEILAREAV
ncbi:hypothetical protein LCGC14_2056500 [marine sediment metagenome]|uniref:Uncharacterized protein n=1 Tax=marine sediment metagenome TaxID=412755 RepID=A0A0F9H0Z8_9ZZZZ